MFKSVLTIILVAGFLWLLRVLQQRLKRLSDNQDRHQQQTASQDMVQCLQCKTYIPRDEAIIKEDKTFCSQQHLEDWKQSD